jgi:hypothetical protein
MNESGKVWRSGFMFAVRIAALTVVLAVLSGIGSMFLQGAISGSGEAAVQTAPASLTVVFSVLFVQALALALLIARSRWHGWRLALAAFVVFFGTQTFMSQVESLVYLGDKMPDGLVAGLFRMGVFVAALICPVAVLLFGKWKSDPDTGLSSRNRLNPGRSGWRILIAGLVFLCLYYLFGYYIAWQDTDLRAYYGGTDPGSFLAQMKSVASGTPWMIPMQYLRGVLWVGLGVLVLQSTRGSRWTAGLVTALLFSAPALYLLLPNPVMPDFPRMTHLVETLPYQFIFGGFLAIFLLPPVTQRD